MLFTYFSFSYNIVKFQTCSWLQNYVIAAYKTIHLPHFLICAKSASEKRIACMCVTEKRIVRKPGTAIQIQNSKYPIWNSKYIFGIPNTLFGIPNTLFGIPNTLFGIPNTYSEFQIPYSEFQIHYLEFQIVYLEFQIHIWNSK